MLQYELEAISSYQHHSISFLSILQQSNQTMKHTLHPISLLVLNLVTILPEHPQIQTNKEQHYQLYILHKLKLFIQKHYAMSSLDHKMY